VFNPDAAAFRVLAAASAAPAPAWAIADTLRASQPVQIIAYCHRLTAAGLLSARWVLLPGGWPRKLYETTDAGRALLADFRRQLDLLATGEPLPT